MTKVVVLGAGMVGSVIAFDLAEDFEVAVADYSGVALENIRKRNNAILTITADLSNPEQIKDVAKDADIVVGALPSVLGFTALQAMIETGVPYVDISFMAEDPMLLAPYAYNKEALAVVDCGIAPGLSNILAGYAQHHFKGECQSIEISVGGVPADPKPPFNYKAAFAPSDVIQEYLRPARLVINGQRETLEALSEVTPIFFEGRLDLLNLESFNTDGLRTLLTLGVPNMVEKTIRYAGHAKLMKVFRDTGFFNSGAPILVPGTMVDACGLTQVFPIDVTQKLFFPHWKYKEGEEDLTLFKVVAQGGNETITWELIDRADPVTGYSSMARTTAFPATVVARMIANNKVIFPNRGIITPERLGANPLLFKHIVEELRRKGLDIKSTIKLRILS